MLRDRTLKSILEDPAIADVASDAITKWDLSKEEYYNWTLRELAEKTAFRSLERGFSRLFELASRGEYRYALYSEEECEKDPEKSGANIVFFPSDDAAADNRPFIMVLPGGGLENVWNITEGWPVAQRFNERGYHAFVLTYRVDVDRAALMAMEDMARAFELIKARKDIFHVQPDSYITCGFSSGGYLICLWNTEKGYSAYNIPKPKACFPVYPATSNRLINAEEWDDPEDKNRYADFCFGCTMEEACSGCYEIPLHVEGFPPTAIFVTADDETVDPEHSKVLAQALDKAGIPYNIEIGESGGHGFGDGTGTGMDGWTERAMNWYDRL